ncbi:MAG TPA: T9SS type A sorting domain-containing protein [Bacteroidota bacterium]|nr:T9SS type A sorting domain-containing protein [Bacteroidota bacterium]
MKNLIKLSQTIFLMAAMFSVARSQTPFWSQANGPYTGRVPALAMKPNGTVIAGNDRSYGSYEGLERSTDQGQTWSVVTTHGVITPGSVGVVAVAPDGSFYVTGGSGDLYRSTDDGLSWTDVHGPIGDIRRLICTPSGVLFAAGPGGLFGSNDGGNTWLQFAPNYGPKSFLRPVPFKDIVCDPSGVIYAIGDNYGKGNFGSEVLYGKPNFHPVGNSGLLQRSGIVLSDAHIAVGAGGKVFAEGYSSTSRDGVVRVYQLTIQGVKLVQTRVATYKTKRRDFWGVWDFAVNPSGDLLIEYEFEDDGTHLVRLSASRKWAADTILTVSTIYTGARILFDATGSTILIGTEEEGVYRSSDKGASWAQTGLRPTAVTAFTQTDNLHLFGYAGLESQLYATSDNGNTWRSLFPHNLTLNATALCGTSQGILLVAFGAGSTLYRSNDNGATWNFLPDTTLRHTNVRSFQVISSSLMLAGADDGIYRSYDNGISWQRGYTGATGAMYRATNGYLYAASAGMIRSTDNGLTWVSASNGLNGTVRSIVSISTGKLIATTTTGLFSSTDNGNSWTVDQSMMRNDLASLIATSNDGIYLSMDPILSRSGVYYSADKGNTWGGENIGLPSSWADNTVDIAILAFSLAPDGHLIAGTVGGTFKSIDQVSSQATPESRLDAKRAVVRSIQLSQNYPNPFNPTTTISFSLPNAAFTTLKIYNALGQEVSTIVSGQLGAGSYNKTWNASGMASGIYYYKLQAGSYVETKKLQLIK